MRWPIRKRKDAGHITTPHSGIAILMMAAMLAAWTTRQLFHYPLAGIAILVIAVAIGSITLRVDTLREICRGNFGVDVLAMISVATALLFRDYWVAAIIILMFSGGKFLEEYATRRASSVLNSLARRMPQVAHRMEAESRVCDIGTDSLRSATRSRFIPMNCAP